MHGFSFPEIAAKLRIGVSAAKLRSSRAMRALRAALGIQVKEDDDRMAEWAEPAPPAARLEKTRLPPGLLAEIGRDLQPVEPLAAPWRRLLLYLPMGIALIAAMPWVWGLRANAGNLGFFATWGLSALQTLAGL